MNNFKMKGGGKMRKTSIVMLLILLSVVLVSSTAFAISGVCSNCHTMHNSQNGLGEVQTYAGGTIISNVTTPQQYLLKASCIACHAGATGQTNSFSAPIVVHTTAPTAQGGTYTLAGGDFNWVATGLGAIDSKGHNVAGLAAADVAITPADTPPGWDFAATTGFTFGQVGNSGDWTNQLTCAGQYGCHGSHGATGGITGAHHGNTGGTATQAGLAGAPTTIGSSYRFLAGIRGLEQSQWNWNESASSHNEYFGVDSPANRDQASVTYANKDTISFSCAECHGFFHSRIDDTTAGTSPWLRHPTDIALKGTGEYTNYTAYSTQAPVARPTVYGSSNGTVAPGVDIVMCLSCHRAHGSPEPDLLRWTYSSMVAGGGGSDTGCFTCHTSKN